MIRSSASFAFFKKSKSLREEVSGLCDSERSINRPPLRHRMSRNFAQEKIITCILYTIVPRGTRGML